VDLLTLMSKLCSAESTSTLPSSTPWSHVVDHRHHPAARERDDVRMREVLQQFDLGIDRLGQHGLVVHSRLERLESEYL
jgi:hypothetical protein